MVQKVAYNGTIVFLVHADCRVGPVQFENQVRDGEEHGVRNHDETAERAQSLEGGRRHILFTASHVCQSVSVPFMYEKNKHYIQQCYKRKKITNYFSPVTKFENVF